MRVLVDARAAAFGERTGIGVYTRSILRELPAVAPDLDVTAWYLRGRDFARPAAFADVAGVRERWAPFPSRLFQIASERWGLPRIEWLAPRFDVLFAPNFVPPPTRSRAVVLTVHDLAFRRFPDTAPHSTRRWLGLLDGALRRAERIVVPSACTRDDLRELYGVEPSRVAVIPHGVDHGRFRPQDPERVRTVADRYGIRRPYLLALGGLEPRKNLPSLLRAFARLRDGARPTLVVAGGAVAWNPEGPSAVRETLASLPSPVRDDVLLTGHMPDDDVPALLSGAVALAYPSRYEGFGLPILEAMACGTPVLTSNVSALPEVAGGAAVLVDPTDVDDIAGGLRRIVDDEALRRTLAATGLDRASHASWPEAARATAAVLREAGERARAGERSR
jgi:glycosyltransferase involved in cell wall biosynthesis